MKKHIAVLHAQVPFVQGGAEIHTGSLVRELRLRGYEAELVSLPFKWYPEESLLDSYLMWRRVDLSMSAGHEIDLVIPLKVPTFMIKHPNKVLWLMHQFRQAYDLKDDCDAGGLNLTDEGRKLISQIEYMDRIGISEAKLKYCNSKTVAQRLKQYNGIAGIPLYHPPGLIGRYYTEEYGDYILSVGRLASTKRVDLLIRALQFCDSRVKVVIAGKGPESENLKKLAETLGVSDRVKLLGFVPDEEVLKLYANALAVCFPPIDEDYGYITLEAFLSKKPIITCRDSGGVLEFAINDQNGMIVDHEPEQIGACFDRLFADKALAREFGNAGYAAVKDISWDNVIDALTQTIR